MNINKTDKNIIKDIYAVGGPSILMQSIGSVMLFGMNLILGSLTEPLSGILIMVFTASSYPFLMLILMVKNCYPILILMD